jgi:Plasmid stabilisation system protein.
VKVFWTDHASRQLSAIHEHIAQDSARYAKRVVDRLTRRSQQIGQFPNSGRAVPELEHPEIREGIEGKPRERQRSKPHSANIGSRYERSRAESI